MDKKFSLFYIPNGLINIAILLVLHFKAHFDFLLCASIFIFIIEFVSYFMVNFFMNSLYKKDIQKFYSENRSFTIFSLFMIFVCTIESFRDINLLIAIMFLKSVSLSCIVWFYHAKHDKIQYHESELEKINDEFL